MMNDDALRHQEQRKCKKNVLTGYQRLHDLLSLNMKYRLSVSLKNQHHTTNHINSMSFLFNLKRHIHMLQIVL